MPRHTAKTPNMYTLCVCVCVQGSMRILWSLCVHPRICTLLHISWSAHTAVIHNKIHWIIGTVPRLEKWWVGHFTIISQTLKLLGQSLTNKPLASSLRTSASWLSAVLYITCSKRVLIMINSRQVLSLNAVKRLKHSKVHASHHEYVYWMAHSRIVLS